MPIANNKNQNKVINQLKSSPHVEQAINAQKKGVRFINKCVKPDAATYTKSLVSVSACLLVCGFSGYFIKVITTPIVAALVK